MGRETDRGVYTKRSNELLVTIKFLHTHPNRQLLECCNTSDNPDRGDKLLLMSHGRVDGVAQKLYARSSAADNKSAGDQGDGVVVAAVDEEYGRESK